MSDREKKRIRRLAQKTVENLGIIASLLKQYERGDRAMYIPIAAQLRTLLCDTRRKKDNSLLGRLMPGLKVIAFREIKDLPGGGPLSFAPMPFNILETPSGIVVAEFEFSSPAKYISLEEWRGQVVTYLPCRMTVSNIVRTVCDKGGGAHVDDDDGPELAAMLCSGPVHGGIQIPFTIAAARFALNLGHTLMSEHGHTWGIGQLPFDRATAFPFGRWEWTLGSTIVEKES